MRFALKQTVFHSAKNGEDPLLVFRGATNHIKRLPSSQGWNRFIEPFLGRFSVSEDESGLGLQKLPR